MVVLVARNRVLVVSKEALATDNHGDAPAAPRASEARELAREKATESERDREIERWRNRELGR